MGTRIDCVAVASHVVGCEVKAHCLLLVQPVVPDAERVTIVVWHGVFILDTENTRDEMVLQSRNESLRTQVSTVSRV